MPPSLHAAPVAAPAFSPDPLRCFSQHLRVFWPTPGFLPLPPQSYKLHSHDFRLTPVTWPALIIHAEHAWFVTGPRTFFASPRRWPATFVSFYISVTQVV